MLGDTLDRALWISSQKVVWWCIAENIRKYITLEVLYNLNINLCNSTGTWQWISWTLWYIIDCHKHFSFRVPKIQVERIHNDWGRLNSWSEWGEDVSEKVKVSESLAGLIAEMWLRTALMLISCEESELKSENQNLRMVTNKEAVRSTQLKIENWTRARWATRCRRCCWSLPLSSPSPTPSTQFAQVSAHANGKMVSVFVFVFVSILY